ncbi:MAG: hypothetical protein IIX01_03465, partial [Clostridia bacterium]|nr:hypothetical protein [Clostridia bacterium]
MYLYFNPVHTACKTVTGGVKEGEEFQLNIFCLTAPFEAEKGESLNENARLYGYTDADFVLRKDGEDKEEYYPMEITPFGWSLRLALNETGLYFYHFKIGNEFLLQGKKKNAILSTNPNGPRYQLIVSSADYTTPEWIKGGVMYQIFPDRFYKSGITPDIKGRINRSDWGGIPSFLPNKYGKVLNNDFFGGNFKGIEEKLPYLQSLGVSVVYLNPIFHAKSNHRYDTSDYMQVDPILGSED